MTDRIVLVTGGTGGIGRQTALELAKQGAYVVVTGRDQTRGEDAVIDLMRKSGSSTIDLLLADLSTQSGVRSLAVQFKRKYPRLDVLINNVGLLEEQRRLTVDGIEADFAVNVLAPFLLTHLLMDVLKASAPARVVNVNGGIWGKIDLENLQAERSFRGLDHYSQTKAVAMALTYEFARRVQGTGVTINACFPGAASTPMTQGLSPATLPPVMRLMWPVLKNMVIRDDEGRSAAKAARSSVFLASSTQVEGVSGQYFSAQGKPGNWAQNVYDDKLRHHLWTLCEQLTNLTPAAASSKI